MELIAIAPKELLNKDDWNVIAGGFSKISFVATNKINSFNYNETEEDKTLLLDPDFVGWNFPQEILSKIKNLKYICLTTTTASYIDEEYIRKNGIKLLTVPKYSTDSVAEYLIFLMMCLAKKLPLQLKNQNKQDFSEEYLQIELIGKKVGVVGFGNIGQRICQITSGMGMMVSYWNRTPKETNYKYQELKNLFEKSDVIFITLSNNSSTKKIITDEMLRSMKPSSILISGTGVELHNDKVIREMLKNKRLFGFGAEIANKGCECYEGNAMITSEYAWFTKEATQRRKEIIVNNLMSIVKNCNKKI